VNIKLLLSLLFLTFLQSVSAQNLVETYQLAQQNSPELNKAHYNQLAVGEIKSQSIAQMLPSLSLSGNSGYTRSYNKSRGTFEGGGVYNYWDHGFIINFSQTVFQWSDWVALSQSDNSIAQAEAEYQATLQNLILQTTEAYFNVLSAQDELEFSVANQKAIERQLEQAKQRFDVGLIAITDVHEAQAGYDEAISDQITAKNELDASKEELREIIGENEVNLDPLAHEINFSEPVPNSVAEWTQIAGTNNLNIIAKLNQAEVARKDISKEKSQHYPTLKIVANYGVNDTGFEFSSRGDRQKVGLELQVPIFQGGFVNSKTRQAEYNYQAAKEDLLATKRLVTRDVRNAYRDIFSSIARVRALKAAVSSAQSALEATEAGFEVGTRTMVDVLDGQKNLYKSKQNFSKSRYDYLVSGVKLKQAASNLTTQDLDAINQYLGYL